MVASSPQVKKPPPTTTPVPISVPGTEKQGNDSCNPCLSKDWHLSPCALFWLIVYILVIGMFLAGFIAPYWRDDDDVTHSGLWKICAYGVCYNFVGDSRIPKDGSLMATQAMMCLALLAAIVGGMGHVGWLLAPSQPFYRACVWSGNLIAGILAAIGVLVYGVWVGHRPEGWAYWTSVASAVTLFLCGLITSCNLRSVEDNTYYRS